MQKTRFFAPTRAVYRCFSSTRTPLLATPFPSSPAPPRLPKEEQDRFETLQRSSTGAFSTPHSPTTSTLKQKPVTVSHVDQSLQVQLDAATPNEEGHATGAEGVRVKATGEGDELHPDVRRGVRPEFEGERNPKTGEVGGPKNEPLRWGGGADWSYNGRVTDF